MKLMDKINCNAKTYSTVFQAVPISNNRDIELKYQWLSDAMILLWAALLRGDQGFGDQVGTQLQQDAKSIADALGLDATMSAEKKAYVPR